MNRREFTGATLVSSLAAAWALPAQAQAPALKPTAGKDYLADKPGMPTWRDKGIFATRQLAKRQITWLRSMPRRIVVATDAPDAVPQVLHQVNQLISAKAEP
jgi:tRNA A37 N6-isopentenylltransferase MiaA